MKGSKTPTIIAVTTLVVSALAGNAARPRGRPARPGEELGRNGTAEEERRHQRQGQERLAAGS